MVEQPLVSIILPTYKRSVMLGRAIESVLCQTYQELEVIVVDDNSNGDNFRNATESFMQKYKENPKVKYIKHTANRNGAAARNTGIKSAKGEYIGFLDDDDFFAPEKISRQLKLLNETDSSWGGVCCYHVRRFKKFAYKVYEVKENQTGDYSYEFLSGITSMPSSTLLFKLEVFNEVGLFDETFQRHQDLEFLVRFFRKYRMKINHNFDTFMQVEGFRNYPNSKRAHEIKSQFLEKYKNEIEFFEKEKRDEINKFQWFDIACLYLKDRNIRTSIILFKQNVFNNTKMGFSDVFKIIFFLLSGYIPFFKSATAFILGLTKHRHHSGTKVLEI